MHTENGIDFSFHKFVQNWFFFLNNDQFYMWLFFKHCPNFLIFKKKKQFLIFLRMARTKTGERQKRQARAVVRDDSSDEEQEYEVFKYSIFVAMKKSQ